jgi:hypothetical protein
MRSVHRAGRVFVQTGWVPPPAKENLAAAMHVLSNPMFVNDNVSDAIVINMPLVPPPPARATGQKRKAAGNHQRVKFAKVQTPVAG